jgi:tRNA(fMet)-specific endonuclease VapC
MTRYLLDTNHVSAVFKSQLNLLNHPKAVAGDEFGVSIPGMGELWFMVYNSTRIAQNLAQMNAALAAFEWWAFDPAAAEQFGKLKAELRRAGRPIPDVDVQIASIALVNGLTLLTADAHFLAIAGLPTDNWVP